MIQFITHYTERYTYIDSVRIALDGGCRWIQLRMKDADDKTLRTTAEIVRRMCSEYGALLIIDDHVELVRQTEADGVHLGLNDMPVDEARNILGSDYIIGGTANKFKDVVLHYRNGADYIGCGPFRYTSTKKKLSPVLGLDGYRDILRLMKEQSIDIPLVAIGGITAADIPALKSTGISGIALSGSILRAEHPTEEMKKIIESGFQTSTVTLTRPPIV